MAIQMRRGLKKDFDPSKMLPGEWAVSIDSSTSNQIVWMCFAAGVCKRMGTYEDFAAQIAGATDDIRVQYVDEFNAILADIQALADTVSSDKDIVVVAKSDIVDTYVPQIQAYVNEAQESSSDAVTKAEEALGYSVISKSYAVGGTGTRENEDKDNAEYYYQQAKSTAESLGSPINPQGTIAFEDLPPMSEVGTNWMYNISNEFTTTDDFVEGAGNVMPLGTNVYKTSSGKWDCFAGSPVTGIKGNKETTYRKGNVNITPSNIGAIAEGGDTDNNIVSFSSGDSTNPTGLADINIVTSGETHASLFRKFSLAVKNLRYLYKLIGTTDISSVGDGTVTGCLSTLNNVVSKSANGLAPKLPNETNITKFLRQDGNWAEPEGIGGTAFDVTYDNTESGLTATNVQDAIDEQNSNLYEVKTISSTGTTSDVGTLVLNRDGVGADVGAIFLHMYDSNANYWCKLYNFTENTFTIGICNFNNENVANEQHTIYSTWLIKKKYNSAI